MDSVKDTTQKTVFFFTCVSLRIQRGRERQTQGELVIHGVRLTEDLNHDLNTSLWCVCVGVCVKGHTSDESVKPTAQHAV